MGLLDNTREEHVDRHDHNILYEGNVLQSASGNSVHPAIVGIVAFCVCASIIYGFKVIADKCVNKVIRAVRREAVVPRPEPL